MVILIYIYIYTHLKGTTGLACTHHRGATLQVSESSCKKNLVVIIIIIIIIIDLKTHLLSKKDIVGGPEAVALSVANRLVV